MSEELTLRTQEEESGECSSHFFLLPCSGPWPHGTVVLTVGGMYSYFCHPDLDNQARLLGVSISCQVGSINYYVIFMIPNYN